jgi:hypothetical protein
MVPRTRLAGEGVVEGQGHCRWAVTWLFGAGLHLGRLKRSEGVIRAGDNNGGLNSISTEYKSRMVPLHHRDRLRGAGILSVEAPRNIGQRLTV